MSISSNPPKPGLSKGASKKRFNVRSMEDQKTFRSPREESIDEIRRYKKRLLRAETLSDLNFNLTGIQYHKNRIHNS